MVRILDPKYDVLYKSSMIIKIKMMLNLWLSLFFFMKNRDSQRSRDRIVKITYAIFYNIGYRAVKKYFYWAPIIMADIY